MMVSPFMLFCCSYPFIGESFLLSFGRKRSENPRIVVSRAGASWRVQGCTDSAKTIKVLENNPTTSPSCNSRIEQDGRMGRMSRANRLLDLSMRKAELGIGGFAASSPAPGQLRVQLNLLSFFSLKF